MEKANFLRIDRQHLALAIAFVTLNIVDNILTHFSLANGGYELNPIARYGLRQNELKFWCFETGIALLGVALLLLLAKRYPRQISRIFIGFIGAMAGVCVFNGAGLVL